MMAQMRDLTSAKEQAERALDELRQQHEELREEHGRVLKENRCAAEEFCAR